MAYPQIEFGFSEDGSRCAVTQFDYDAVDAAFTQDLSSYFKTKKPRKAHAEKPEEFTVKELDAAIKVIDRLLCWIWANGMRNPEGVKIRAIVACWILLKPLRVFSLTGVSKLYGKKKQSLGRWVDQFKQDFRFLTPHMRPLGKSAKGNRHTTELLAALRGAEAMRRATVLLPTDRWPQDWQTQMRRTIEPTCAQLFCSACPNRKGQPLGQLKTAKAKAARRPRN
jgi:hypothetical protein